MIPDIPLRKNEEVIRSAEHVTIKNGRYHLVLTTLRIIVISEETGRPADINLADIRSAAAGQNPAGVPAILLDALSSNREVRTMILGFTPAGRSSRDRERDQWLADIGNLIQPSVREPVPQQPRQPIFCSRCGRAAPVGAAFCDRCGTPLVQPQHPPAHSREPGGPTREPAGRPVQKKPSATVTVTRKYADIPLVSPEVRAVKVAPAPRRVPEKRIRSGRFSRRKIAAGAGIAGIVLVIVLLLSIPGIIPDFSQVLNMSGNASTTNGTPAIHSSPLKASASSSLSRDIPEKATSSSADSPELIYEQYMGYYQTGDAAGMYNLLSDSVKSTLTEDNIATVVASQLTEGSVFGGYTVVNSDISDDSAVLVFQTTWVINGETRTGTETIPFVRENGQWRLNSFISASLWI